MNRDMEIDAIQELRIASERLAVIADGVWSRRLSTYDIHDSLCKIIEQVKEAKRALADLRRAG